jgi:hypothetical protein
MLPPEVQQQAAGVTISPAGEVSVPIDGRPVGSVPPAIQGVPAAIQQPQPAAISGTAVGQAGLPAGVGVNEEEELKAQLLRQQMGSLASRGSILGNAFSAPPQAQQLGGNPIVSNQRLDVMNRFRKV